jgi:N6-L-threonylcarbamoyladenine synthase
VIVGLTTAKAIAMVHDTPLIAVNHLEAHALTPRLTSALAFPYACSWPPGATPRSSPWSASDNMSGSAPPSTTRWRGLRQGRQRCCRCPNPADRRSSARLAGGNAKRFAFPRPMLGRPDANFSCRD